MFDYLTSSRGSSDHFSDDANVILRLHPLRDSLERIKVRFFVFFIFIFQTTQVSSSACTRSATRLKESRCVFLFFYFYFSDDAGVILCLHPLRDSLERIKVRFFIFLFFLFQDDAGVILCLHPLRDSLERIKVRFFIFIFFIFIFQTTQVSSSAIRLKESRCKHSFTCC
jgi:hypothetical protein